MKKVCNVYRPFFRYQTGHRQQASRPCGALRPQQRTALLSPHAIADGTNRSGSRSTTIHLATGVRFVASFARSRVPCSSMRASLNHTVRSAPFPCRVRRRSAETFSMSGPSGAKAWAQSLSGMYSCIFFLAVHKGRCISLKRLMR